MDTHEIAWAAGFYDGEGSTTTESREGKWFSVRVSIFQVDRRALDRFKAAVGEGTIRGPYNRGLGKKTKWKPYYQYAAAGPAAKRVIEKLWPYLGEVKKEQARLVITNYMNRPLPKGVYKGMEETVGAWELE